MSPIIDSLGLVKGYGWGSASSLAPIVDRGFFFGGYNNSHVNTIEYVTISTTGNGQSFGTLSAARGNTAPGGNGARIVIAGGVEGSTYVNKIEHITPSTTGNSVNFGTMASALINRYPAANDTRLVLGGGYNNSSGYTNAVDYVTIATTGNTTSWGSVISRSAAFGAGSGSTTRGIFHAGAWSSGYNGLHWYVTFATTGQSLEFGEDAGRQQIFAGSSSTRSIWGGGRGPDSSQLPTVRFLTIATTGSFNSFGSLTAIGSYWYDPTGSSNSIRAIAGGGQAGEASNYFSNIQYFTIATTGNAENFGSLTASKNVSGGGASGAHGGLSR